MQPLWKENTRSREQALSRFRQTWRAEISYRRLADINLNVGPIKHALCCQRKTHVCEKKLRRFAATLTHTQNTELVQDSTQRESKVYLVKCCSETKTANMFLT